MTETSDMVLPIVREMRAELTGRFDAVSRRFDAVDQWLEAIEAAQKSFKQALSADSLLSKLVTGEFQQRIELLEEKVERLEAGR